MTNQSVQWNQHIIDEFRANNGITANFGRGLLLIHHIGAKTGTERVSPVAGIRVDNNTWLIAATKAGAPENPAWYHNLLAHPDVTIEVPGEGPTRVHVDTLVGAERDAGWARFTAMSAGFREYEKRTTRTIPVLALHRQAR